VIIISREVYFIIIKELYNPLIKSIYNSLNISFCYGSGIPCHVVTCTSVVIGGVERQNSVFIYELNLVNNFFLL
jgi:hypothetical protein